MKRIFLMVAMSSCTNTDMASISAFGRPWHIKCYSGGSIIFEGYSTGRIQSARNSDGWEFEDKPTGKFVRVSGTCIILN